MVMTRALQGQMDLGVEVRLRSMRRLLLAVQGVLGGSVLRG
jgi:hypothetical protein